MTTLFTNLNIPNFSVKLIDQAGYIDRNWYLFLLQLWQRTGGSQGDQGGGAGDISSQFETNESAISGELSKMLADLSDAQAFQLDGSAYAQVLMQALDAIRAEMVFDNDAAAVGKLSNRCSDIEVLGAFSS